MKTPFENIGDANTETAFLTNAEGYDVAVLERVTVRAPGLPAENDLSPEDWQRTIDLVNHAPAMARMISAIYDKLNNGITPLPSDDFWNPVRQIAPDIQH